MKNLKGIALAVTFAALGGSSSAFACGAAHNDAAGASRVSIAGMVFAQTKPDDSMKDRMKPAEGDALKDRMKPAEGEALKDRMKANDDALKDRMKPEDTSTLKDRMKDGSTAK
jgi:hypothetical protein